MVKSLDVKIREIRKKINKELKRKKPVKIKPLNIKKDM